MRRRSNPPARALVLGTLAMPALLASSVTHAFPKADPAAAPRPGASAPAPAARKPAAPPVDLNRASTAELKKLPGIGDAEAARIVAHRPYQTKTDLVEKKVLTLEAYDRIGKQVVVDHRKPAPKPKS